ncbi:MAG: hypothetical protein ABIR84_03645 [Candidatus Nitrotoga sp.]
MEEQKSRETERIREAVLLLKTDMNCRLMVNNDNHGALQKNTPLSIVLPLGSHLINVITPDGLLEKEWIQDLNFEEHVVYLIQLEKEYAQLQAKREE